MKKSGLWRRMETLNRRPLQDAPKRRRSPNAPQERQRAAEPDHYNLPPGIVAESEEGGTAYLIESDAAELDASLATLARGYETSDAARAALRQKGVRPEDALNVMFMDIETTGFSNRPLFLIGAMVWRDGKFSIRQYFARHYGEERAVLSLYVEALRSASGLVTFNGASFDVPFIRKRCERHGLPAPPPVPNLDMFHVCKRVWGSFLPNCKLVTLEDRVCGRRRRGDIPGSLIPAAYQNYAQTGETHEMAAALKHNALDLAAMADLMVRLPVQISGDSSSRRRRRSRAYSRRR